MTTRIKKSVSGDEFFNAEQRKILKAQLKDATDLDFERFLITCQRTGLDPFSRQIYGRLQNKRVRKPYSKNTDPDNKKWEFVKELIIITSIDGFRAIAERSGEYRGQTAPEWYYKNPDTGVPGWYDVCVVTRDQRGNPITKIDACRVGIKRKDFDAPVFGVANFDSFAVFEKEDVKEGERAQYILGHFWKKMPEHQIAKCAEAQGHRKAFPLLASGIYIEEEIKDDDAEDHIPGGHESKELPSDMQYVPEHDPKNKSQEAPQPPQDGPKITAASAGAASKPKGDKPAPEPKAPASEEQSPFGDEPAPTTPAPKAEKPKAEPKSEPWQDYEISQITIAKYQGKKLSELSQKDISDLQSGWVEKYADKIAKNPAKVREAEMITAAHKALNK